MNLALATLIREATGLTHLQVKPSTEIVAVSAANVPLILYTLLGVVRGLNDDGSDGLAVARYQLDIFGSDANTAEALSAAVTLELHGYRGTTADTSIDLIKITDEQFQKGIQLEGQNNTVARYIVRLNATYRESLDHLGGM